MSPVSVFNVLLTTALVSMVTAIASGQGIRPLDPATFEQAKSAGSAATTGNILNSPFSIAMRSACSQSALAPACNATLARAREAPFFIAIDSPFTRVMGLAEKAKRTYTEPKFTSVGASNLEMVQVKVSPGSSMITLDTITNVIIKRGEQIVRPVTGTIAPTVVQNGLGAKQDSAEGTFVFDFDVFAPDQAITIVMIGKSGNFEWTMPPEELRQMH